MIKYLFKILKVRNKKIYQKNINEVLSILKQIDQDFDLTFVDVGAAGEIHPRWKPISNNLNYIGFEPDERSRSLLHDTNNCKSYFIYPNAIWNINSSIKFQLTKKPEVSSHYYPKMEFLKLFKDSERFKVKKEITLRTTTVDYLDIPSFDFIKLDIQGGELNALKGAEKSLKTCLGIELEVEFIELYSGQPLFGEITEFLNNKGFEFFDFVDLIRWERNNFNSLGQCVFGDALFLKTPEFILKNINFTSRYLSICLLYNRLDLIDRYFELSQEDLIEKYEPFIIKLKYFKRRKKLLIKFNKLTNKFLNIFFQETKFLINY